MCVWCEGEVDIVGMYFKPNNIWKQSKTLLLNASLLEAGCSFCCHFVTCFTDLSLAFKHSRLLNGEHLLSCWPHCTARCIFGRLVPLQRQLLSLSFSARLTFVLSVSPHGLRLEIVHRDISLRSCPFNWNGAIGRHQRDKGFLSLFPSLLCDCPCGPLCRPTVPETKQHLSPSMWTYC